MSTAEFHRAGRSLLGNSVAILVMTLITTALGYVFWVACARGTSAGAVGLAGAVIPAMTFVAVVAVSGFIPLLTRVLPGADPEERSGLCSTAFVLTAVVSGAVGVVGAPLLPAPVQYAIGTGWLMGLLGVGAAATALGLVVNAALLGIRRADLSLPGSVVGSASRLAVIAGLAGLGLIATRGDSTAARTILMVWVASLVVSVVLSLRLLARATPRFRFTVGRVWLSRLWREVAWDHVAMLGRRLPDLLVPIVAAAFLPLDKVGYLAMAWTVGLVFTAVPDAVSNALLADCADSPGRLRAQVRRAVALIAVLQILPVLIGCLLASKILALFGADYAAHSTVLVLLILATIPEAVITVSVAILRVHRRLFAAAAVSVMTGALSLGGAVLLMPRLGIEGAGWAALAAPAMVVAVLPVLLVIRPIRKAPIANVLDEPVTIVAGGSAPIVELIPHAHGGGRDANRTLTTPPLERERLHGHVGDNRLEGLRILLATDGFLPNVGGLELSYAELARAQVRRGRVVAVATAPHPDAPTREDLDGAQIHRLPMAIAKVPGLHASRNRLFFPPFPDPLFARRFADLIESFQPDIIHTQGWVLYSVLGPAQRADVPVVAAAHDHSQVCATKVMLYHDTTVCSGPGLRKCVGCAYSHYGVKGIPLAAGLHQLGSRRHSEVAEWIAISTALAARGSAPRPADRSPMAVVPTFLDDDLLALASDERTAARPDFVPAAGPYLFYAGVLGPHKGVDILLDAHARLRSGGMDVPLVLAGLPRDDFEVPDRPGVSVVKNVSRALVVAGWRHATVGVVPSVVPEGFGRVAVECLAAGTPCVVSALGGLLDVVADGVEGLHVPPGDAEALACALRRLLADDALRLRLGAAGPAKAAQFTLAQVIPRLDEVYLRVLNDRQARGGSNPSGWAFDRDGDVVPTVATDSRRR